MHPTIVVYPYLHCKRMRGGALPPLLEGRGLRAKFVMIEVIDDTAIERYFEDNSGNIYEGDGPAANLAAGTLEQIEASFQKENNEQEADWRDIEALYAVLHAAERTTDPEAWRTKLEALFDVDVFLEWLAISAVIQHWDTYGAMTHNYYLYNDPETGRLTWISWDHNLVLGAFGGGRGGPAGQAGQGGGMRGPGGMGGRGSTSLDKQDETFAAAVQQLIERTNERARAAADFLATQ